MRGWRCRIHRTHVVDSTAAGNSSPNGGNASPSTPPPTPPTPPPTPTGLEDPALIYDGPGGITGTHLYATLLPWKNPGGDWLDADGVPQGSRPFGEALLKTGQSGEFVVDVTRLVVQGSEPSLVLRAVATSGMAPIFYFSTRESGQGPRLVVTYVGGATDSIPVMYDSECTLSTAYVIGSKTAMMVGGGSNAYLRFPAPTRPVASAKLVLNGGINTGGKLAVYKFALFRDPPPTDTFTLKGDPRVFFETPCFERGTTPPYIDAKVWDLYTAYLGGKSDPLQQRAIVSDDEGGKALQITFDPRTNTALDAFVCFPGFEEADEAAWEFDLRLMPDMATGIADAFKLFAGCSSSSKNDDAAFCNYAGVPQAVGRLFFGCCA